MNGDLFDAVQPELWRLALGSGEPGGGTARKVGASYCGRCGDPVLRGVDDDVCGLAITCDPEPLSAFGEVQATLASRRTAELRREKAGLRLDRRSRDHVRGRPAGSGRIDVLAEHRCGIPLDHAGPVLHARRPADPNAKPDF